MNIIIYKIKTTLFLIILINLFFSFFYTFKAYANEDFNIWLNEYKKNALEKGISKKTIDSVFKKVKFLEKVLVYDRRQPEFFEDTNTYVKKRATASRSKKAIELFKKNESLFLEVESKFNVEKEILLALWGIETNFGKHVGKMDIISSIATLSFDKRRSEFFSAQLFILLKLVDKNLIEPEKLYGSWAGAYGNFQFMPSTIERYAIDYDNNNKIELKESLDDSLASAANYISKIGWKEGEPCFYKVKLTKKINQKYINTSARTISSRLKVSKWKKMGVEILDNIKINNKLKAALILPDGKENSPTFLVFQNYEKILKWNRSLRFGVSVCTLANMIKT